MAGVVARRSLCVRDRVGAVVVDQNMRIVATGYNGPPAGFKLPDRDVTDRPCVEWCPRAAYAAWLDAPGAPDLPDVAGPGEGGPHSDYSDCPSLHAEANALSVCDRSARRHGTIYVTSDVCWACAKLIANSGLARVVMVPGLARTAHRDPERSRAFLVACGLAVTVATG